MEKETTENIDYLNNIRHSAAHLLAAAVMELWPDTKRTIGPAVENGFYYDFDFSQPISEEDLPKIEEKMKQILNDWEKTEGREVSEKDAREMFADNPYKLELIDEIVKEGQPITIYKSGEYEDLCKGGHSQNPKEELKNFKLLSIAGAYWRGSEKNKMLTRIYGTVFPAKEELEGYINQLEEAKKRDHKKLARELDLIVFSELVGGGLPLYTPKGALLRNLVYNFSRQLNAKIGYEETALPGVNKGELFKVSGHYEKYKDDMFTVHSHYSKEEYFLKPMNCPQHCILYGSRARSYKELPIRYSDFSVLYRDEKPGEINGLLRSRAFTQDDGHCFCREDQIGDEFKNVLQVIDEALKGYGFSYWIRLSLRDPQQKEKYLGDDAVWERAESKLREIVTQSQIPFIEGVGEAAIYGPKLDFMTKDSLGREWQISTIQLDMIMPVRFGLHYTDSDGGEKTPFLIHRAIVGSERFIAILIEHFAGAFPTWLAPIQVEIIPISDKYLEYVQKLNDKLVNEVIRSQIDSRAEKMQAKIRDAQLQKIPYMVIVGDKEASEETVSIRKRSGESINNIPFEQFLQDIKKEIATKA